MQNFRKNIAMILMMLEATGAKIFSLDNVLESESLKAELEVLMQRGRDLQNATEKPPADEIINLANQIKSLKAAIGASEELENALRVGDVENMLSIEPENKVGLEMIVNLFNGNKVENAITTTTGGLVIYKELATKIIKLIKDRSSAFAFFNSSKIKGVARIPIQATSGDAKWADENADPTPTTEPTLEVLELGQNRLYKESAITQQMINIEELSLEDYLAEDIAEAMLDTVEMSIFQGSGVKQPTGIIGSIPAGKKVDLAVRGVVSVDDFKKAKAKVKKAKRKNARWFMNADTYLLVDLLKDTTGRPLLQPDITSDTGESILGIPVDTTDCMPAPDVAGAQCLVILATPEAYHTNTQKDIALYVFRDSVYIRKGLVGYAADMYMDGKPKDIKQSAAGIFNKA